MLRRMLLAGSPEQILAAVEETFAGRYVIDAPLPWNGLASVFRAVEPGRSVAVAVFGGAWEGDRRDKFLRRAQAIAELPHPTLLAIHERGIVGDVAFLEMELPSGRPLSQVMAEEGPFDRDRAFRVADAVLDLLEVVHDLSAMHWDLTPSNVILSPDGEGSERVRVLGVGFRALLGPAGQGLASGPEGERFIAPEVWQGRPDGRADQYSVGALLQWMISGRPPGGPGGFGRGAAWARPVVVRAMARRRQDRFPDARSMRVTLRKAYEGQVVPMPTRPELRRALLWTAAGVTCLGLGIVGGLQLRGLRSTVAAVDAPAVAGPADDRGPEREKGPGGAVAPPGPLASGIPEPLRDVYEDIRRGVRLDREALGPIQAYTRTHPDDVRGHLVLAHAFAHVGWQSAAIERFVIAFRVDPLARHDAHLVEVLLGALPHPDFHHDASKALSVILDVEAIEPVEGLLASAQLDWEERQRVRRYLERLKGRARRSGGQTP
jgi:hypothetical protein